MKKKIILKNKNETDKIMKLSKEQKEKIQTCIKDLEYYYQTCGNDADFENLELLKVHLNTIQINLPNIEAYAVEVFENDEKKFGSDDDFNVFNPINLINKDQ